MSLPGPEALLPGPEALLTGPEALMTVFLTVEGTNMVHLEHSTLHCYPKHNPINMTSRHTAAAGPKEREYSALLSRRKEKIYEWEVGMNSFCFVVSSFRREE